MDRDAPLPKREPSREGNGELLRVDDVRLRYDCSRRTAMAIMHDAGAWKEGKGLMVRLDALRDREDHKAEEARRAQASVASASSARASPIRAPRGRSRRTTVSPPTDLAPGWWRKTG
jgi:hypothetical protein